MKFLVVLFLLTLPLQAKLPENCQQVVVGVAKSWDSSHVTLYLYQKNRSTWTTIAGPWNGRLGKNGLAWGLGIHQIPASKRVKREGDGRAPAGIFEIGGAWGYAPNIKKHPKLFYRQVTTRDLWYEDSSSPHYNSWRTIPHEPRSTAEKKAQMRQNDYPHSLKLFVAHNSPPNPTPGAGSAIFFHIWRNGGKSATHGCTTIPEPQLRTLIATINPNLNPHYVLLPQSEYNKLRQSWKLP